MKVTLESQEDGYLDAALARFLTQLPADAVVKVT